MRVLRQLSPANEAEEKLKSIRGVFIFSCALMSRTRGRLLLTLS